MQYSLDKDSWLILEPCHQLPSSLKISYLLSLKVHSCFCSKILKILRKKSFIQSFVVVLIKLRSHKVLNLTWVASYQRLYQTFQRWLSLYIFVNFMEKKPFTHFYGRCDHFSWTYEVAKLWMIKLCLDVSGVIHARRYLINLASYTRLE